MILVMTVMAVAAAGSGAAALRQTQPYIVRLAHAVMGLVMLTMILPAGRVAPLAGLIAVILMMPVILGHFVRHGGGLPCATDLLGMALLLGASLAPHPQPRIIVLVAACWVIGSLWAHGEAALATRVTLPSLLEAVTAVAGAVAMGLMTVMMS